MELVSLKLLYFLYGNSGEEHLNPDRITKTQTTTFIFADVIVWLAPITGLRINLINILKTINCY